MNMNFNGLGPDAQFLFFLAAAWGLFVTIMWLVIGWRAMKAHERIAESFREFPGRRSRNY